MPFRVLQPANQTTSSNFRVLKSATQPSPRFRTSTQVKEQKKPLLQRIAGGFTSFFGGKQIGKRLGGVIAGKFLGAEGNLRKAGFSEEQIKENLKGGVSNRQLFADIANVGLNIGLLATTGGVANAARLAARQGGRAALRLGARRAVTGFGIGVGLGATRELAEGGTLAEAARTGAITGGIVAGLPPAISSATRLAGTSLRGLATTFSGVPKRAFDFATKFPQKISTGLNKIKANPQAYRKIVDVADKAFGNLVKEKSKAFEVGFNKIVSQNPNVKVNIPSALQTTAQEWSNRGVKTAKVGFNFAETGLDETEERLVQRAWNLAKDKKITNLSEAQALKRKLAKFFKFNKTDEYNALVLGLKNNVNNQITTSLPRKSANQLASLNKNFSEQSELIENITTEFKLGRAQDNPRLIINALRKAFQQDTDLGIDLLDELGKAGGQEAIDLTAAYFFRDWFPEQGLQRVLGLGAGSIAALFAAISGKLALAVPFVPLVSPKLSGLGARIIGRTGQLASRLGAPEQIRRRLFQTGLGNIVPEIRRRFGR